MVFVEDFQRFHQLAAEKLRTAAVIGQCRQRIDNLITASNGAIAGFNTPERHDHGRINAVFIADFLKLFFGC